MYKNMYQKVTQFDPIDQQHQQQQYNNYNRNTNNNNNNNNRNNNNYNNNNNNNNEINDNRIIGIDVDEEETEEDIINKLLNYDYIMDDRESVYLDTISITSDNNRKSLSMSRHTIYHSAEDLTYDNEINLQNMKKLTKHQQQQQKDIKNNKNYNNYEYYNKKANQFIMNEQNNYDNIDGRRVTDELQDGQQHIDTDDDELEQRYQHRRQQTQQNDETWRRFNDGIRSVDYVLAYEPNDTKNTNNDKQFNLKRILFEKNLENEGLQLEIEETQKIHFLKIHAPHDVLCRYCEILKMKMPIKQDIRDDYAEEDRDDDDNNVINKTKKWFDSFIDYVKVNENLFPKKKNPFKCEYTRNKNYLFNINNEDFFTPSIRISVVHFILERTSFVDSDMPMANSIGIDKLLSDGVYNAAYPLHDGGTDTVDSQRGKLFTEWAAIKKWIKHQPIDNIKEYFGEQIALYFAWLGFYTHMLIPASIFGLITFLFGLFTLHTNRISQDICADDNTIIMCPQCDALCDYWYLRDTCVYSKLNHLFDNNMTVAFACFMSIWATVYLELWKRYSSRILHRWGLIDFCHQAEQPRPAYIARLSKIKSNSIKNYGSNDEPTLPYWRKKFPIYVMSFSVVISFILLAIASVFGVIIYRMSQTTSRNIYGSSDSMMYNIMVLPATAAVINLVVITILNFVYDYLAVYLTNIEYHRTQTEYEDSLTLKIYLFQFINYYSSIFYIAFLKGKFVGYPAKYNRIFKFRQEECGPGGCLMELCIQLTIIMVGKQAINAVIEMLIPFIMKHIKKFQIKIGMEKENEILIACSQWTEDFKLLIWPVRGLFDEYLEMIIQFGFITIFVVAFPLAPLFALINNIFEMRLDAKKFLKFYRRSIPKRVKDIGIWYSIMHILVRISVASSAFIIAFSSNFIPRLFYMITVNQGISDSGYLNYTLAYFNTSDFQEGTAPLNTAFENVEICRYNEFRNPPWDPNPYKRPLMYWRLFTARLAFIVVFQYVVGFVQMFVAWAIPDQPRSLRNRIKSEDYLVRELIIKKEKEQAIFERTRHKLLNKFKSNSNPNAGGDYDNLNDGDGAAGGSGTHPHHRRHPDNDNNALYNANGVLIQMNNDNNFDNGQMDLNYRGNRQNQHNLANTSL